jgi:hypothetical protein
MQPATAASALIFPSQSNFIAEIPAAPEELARHTHGWLAPAICDSTELACPE